MEEIFIPGTGAKKSSIDVRTIKHEKMTTMAALPDVVGGYDYALTEIEHQHRVGICTAIALTQNARKALGRKFSADFQYLLQKKYFDSNWDEGSSIFNSLKVAKKYGMLPAELFTFVTEADRNLPYAQYIAKLQAISEEDIQKLITQSSDYKLSGYAVVDISTPQTISKAITDSKSGILCRYTVDSAWYTAIDGRTSWSPADINPLRAPKTPESGHAITGSKYDYTTNVDIILANTWGASWNKEGLADTDWNNYKMTEAWIPYYGMTDVQLNELKAKLQAKIGIMQRIIALWMQIKNLTKK